MVLDIDPSRKRFSLRAFLYINNELPEKENSKFFYPQKPEKQVIKYPR
jgi:hypothetical protein